MASKKSLARKIRKNMGPAIIGLASLLGCSSVDSSSQNNDFYDDLYNNGENTNQNYNPPPNPPNNSEEKTFVLYPSDDTYVDSLNPDENYGDEFILMTGKVNWGEGRDADYVSYIKFDMTEIPLGKRIKRAELELITGDNASFVKPVGETQVSWITYGSWDEFGITYRTRPSGTEILDGGFVTFDVVNEHRWDVTEAVRQWYEYNEPNRGFMIDTPTFTKSFNDSGEDYGVFYSHVGGDLYSPKLIVETE